MMVLSDHCEIRCIYSELVLLLALFSVMSACAGAADTVRAMAHNYTVEPVSSEDVNQIRSLLQRTFYVDEPMNKAVGLCADGVETCVDLEEYCMKSLLQGLSLKAVDSQGNIVGVMITGLESNLQGESERELQDEANNCSDPKFVKILQVLIRREQGAKLWCKYPDVRQLAEIKVAATDHGWRNRGIMKALLKATEELVRKRGVSVLRMDTSSAYSAMAAERLGFTCVYRALYSDITVDGHTIILPEPPHLHDCVYIKQLNST